MTTPPHTFRAGLTERLKSFWVWRTTRRSTSGPWAPYSRSFTQDTFSSRTIPSRRCLLELGALLVRRATYALGSSKRSEEHTSELQSLLRISYAVFCLQKKKNHK